MRESSRAESIGCWAEQQAGRLVRSQQESQGSSESVGQRKFSEQFFVCLFVCFWKKSKTKIISDSDITIEVAGFKETQEHPPQIENIID